MSKHSKCNNIVDYSTVVGNRILPFEFSLNLGESVLYPSAGQYQKFCYDVKGIGQDTSQYADLSHFLLGICSSITKDDIVDISVIVDGEKQDVVFGKNVEIKTAEKPDNPTGCAGLKFDFPLNKINGTMQICITLLNSYTVGPVNVCVFGGNTTATGLMICGPACGGTLPCDSVFFQKETVCVPVTVTPYATPGIAEASCCGEPVINTGSRCPGTQTSCSFTITQNLCIKIPISFGAAIETGSASVQCGTVSEEECDCSDSTTAPEIENNNDLRERHFFNR